MYCPQCGQVQAGDVRYCSRCGLSLYEVSLWLAGASELVNPQGGNQELSPRRKNITRAAKVAFFSAVGCPLGFVIGEATRAPLFLIIPMLVLFASLVWMLYSRLFMDAGVPATAYRQPSFKAEETNYLPPRREVELHRPNTSEIVQPGSVTEYTTNLLRKK